MEMTILAWLLLWWPFSTEINVVRKQRFARRSHLFSFTSLLLKRLPINSLSVSYLFDRVYRSPVSTSNLLLLRSPGALFICVENRCEFPPNRRASIQFSFQPVTDRAACFIKEHGNQQFGIMDQSYSGHSGKNDKTVEWDVSFDFPPEQPVFQYN